MAIEPKIEDKGIETMDLKEEENDETYGEVDLEEELMCSLSEIKKLRKNNLKQKEKLQKYEEEDCDSKEKMSQSLEETENTIMNLKVQLEEERRIEELVRTQLKEKEENCKNLESEIVSLIKELKKTTIKLNRRLKFEKSIETLYDIMNCQGYPFIKTGLVYDKSQMTTKEYSKSTNTLKKVNEGKSKIYVDVLKSSVNDEDNMRKENDVLQKIGIHSKDNKDIFKISFSPR
jgi:hypothetical protein